MHIQSTFIKSTSRCSCQAMSGHMLYCYILLCSCIDIGEERGFVAWWPSRVVQHGITMVLIVSFQHKNAASDSGTNIRTEFQHCPGKLMQILLLADSLCVPPMLATISFQSVYLLYHVNTIDVHPMYMYIRFNKL